MGVFIILTVGRMNSLVFVWLLFLCLFPHCGCVPRYSIGLLSPSQSEWEALEIHIDETVDYLPLEFYQEAIRDVNSYFGENFTLLDSYKTSPADPQLVTVKVMEMLSGSSPVIALIGPFHEEKIKFIAPLAESSQVPLISPHVPLSRMRRFLPPNNRFVLSMQAARDTYGSELLELCKYHGWQHIGLVITKSRSGHISPYQENVKNILTLGEQYSVKTEETAWIPSREEYGNDTLTFEKIVRREMTKIWNSGVTVIILSIEQKATTYAAIMRTAIDLGLVNNSTAFVSLNVDTYDSFSRKFYRITNVWDLLLGMIVTHADITDGQDSAPLKITRLRKSSYYNWYTMYTIYQLTYDSVWAIAFAIQKCLSEGVTLNHTTQTGALPLRRWISGDRLLKNLQQTDFEGLSGRVRFDSKGTRTTWYIIKNVLNSWPWLRDVGWWGYNKTLEMHYPIRWHNNTVRSPTGTVDLCRHWLNVLLPGGRYERYIEYPDEEGNTSYFGWAIDLFKQAAGSQCLTNLKFHSKPNMTWDEAIELIGNEEEESSGFDAVVGPFGLTVQRSVKAEFTRTIKSVGYRVAILREPAKTSKLWEFFRPFSWQLWLAIAAFFVLSGLVVFVLEKKRKAFRENSPGILDSMFVSASSLFYTQDQDSVISKSGRGFIVVVCFVVLILCACFTANLSVFLLKRQHTVTYRSITDIHDGIIGASHVTGALQYLQQVYPQLKFEDIPPVNGLEKLVAKEIAAYVDDASILEFQALTNCKIELLEGKMHTVNAAFAVRHQSPYKDKLNQGIMEAWADNYIEELERKYFEWADECHDYGQVAEDESLELQHVGGLFIVFSVTAALCLTGDLILRCLHKNHCIDLNLDKQSVGVHAVARGAKGMIETTANISLAGSLASSTWSLTERGLLPSEQMPVHKKKKQKQNFQESSTLSRTTDLLEREPPSRVTKRGPLPPIDL